MRKRRNLWIPLLVLALLITGIILLSGDSDEDGDGPDDLWKPFTKSEKNDDNESKAAPRVVLDAGHGGHDTGALGFDDRLEKDDTLRVTLLVESYLLENGVEVLMTRSEDVYPTLEERCQMANDWEAELFVSLHRNSGGGNGLEIWKPSDSGKQENKIADEIHKRLIKVGEPRDRGIRKGTQSDNGQDYMVNRETQMCSCLLELGFMDSETDNAWFDTYIEEIAEAVAEGILAYLDAYH